MPRACGWARILATRCSPLPQRCDCLLGTTSSIRKRRYFRFWLVSWRPIVWAARRLPLRYAAWGAGFLVVAVLQGYYVRSVTAAPRHILEWFPLFFAIAVLLRPPRPWLLTPLWPLASAVVLAAYAAM